METGVLKVGRVEHHLSSIDEKTAGNDSVVQLGYLNPKIYRVKNDVVSTALLLAYCTRTARPILERDERSPHAVFRLGKTTKECQAPKAGMRQILSATRHGPNYHFLKQVNS